MRTKLRWAALVLALVVVAVWFFGGPNLGWTKNSVMHEEKDPVTGLEGPVYENRWIPGVDFVVVGVLAAGLVAGGSFLFRPKAEGQRA